MGCSASSHAGVVGLYSIPKDDGDRSLDDIMEEDEAVVRAQYYLRHGSGGIGPLHHNGQRQRRAHPSSSCPSQTYSSACQPQQEDDLPCGSLCQNHNTSPERWPLPPGRTNLAMAMMHSNSSGARAVTPTPMQQQPSLNDSSLINSIIDTSILDSSQYDDHSDTPNSHVNNAFANRQWLVFPEHQYDMNTLHPSLPPFLGSMYWTAASPLPAAQHSKVMRARINTPHDRMNDGNKKNHFPSLITPSVDESPMEVSRSGGTPFTRFGIQMPEHIVNESSTTRSSELLAKERADKLILSLNSTEDWESEATSVSYSNDEEDDDEHDNNLNAIHGAQEMKLFSPRDSVDISRELLDYSILDESYVLEQKRSHQPPRRLFDEDDEDGDDNSVIVTDRGLDESFEVVATPKRKKYETTNSQMNQVEHQGQGQNNLSSILCMAPGVSQIAAIPEEQLATISQPRPPSSPNVATFYGHWGSRRERHVSTLPSTNPSEPIRLRVTDRSGHNHHDHMNKSGSRIKHTMSSTTHSTNTTPVDSFSYDPYFSNGKYTITLPNGKPYGNGLVMKMGVSGGFMILEDSRGAVLAVIKSRYTHTPSMVVYAPKKRFGNQVASGHRLTRQASSSSANGGKKSVAVVVDGNNNNGIGMMEDNGQALYPWALISKDGRTMNDDCTVHLVNDGADGSSSLTSSTRSSFRGIFRSVPSFRGRHGFDRGLHTHTVVSRTITSGRNNNHVSESAGRGTSLEEVPCCVIVRDSSNMDAVDITIAPGIDPLLMICYLASHSKMDVEPIMSGF